MKKAVAIEREPSVARVPIEKLVLDFRIYPRTELQGPHIAQMVEAIRAGVVLPPIKADRASLRVTDGFHRVEAHKRLKLTDIDAHLIPYPSEAAMFEDAIRSNAAHGRPLALYERKRCVQIAQELGLSLQQVADALHVRMETVEGWVRGFAPTMEGKVVPVKRGLVPEGPLSERQQEVNARWGGMQATYHARQLIAYLEGGFYRPGEAQFEAAMDKLTELWRKVKEHYGICAVR